VQLNVCKKKSEGFPINPLAQLNVSPVSEKNRRTTGVTCALLFTLRRGSPLPGWPDQKMSVRERGMPDNSRKFRSLSRAHENRTSGKSEKTVTVGRRRLASSLSVTHQLSRDTESRCLSRQTRLAPAAAAPKKQQPTRPGSYIRPGAISTRAKQVTTTDSHAQTPPTYMQCYAFKLTLETTELKHFRSHLPENAKVKSFLRKLYTITATICRLCNDTIFPRCKICQHMT